MKHITLRTHEVQQIIAGRQTRLSRPVKPQPGPCDHSIYTEADWKDKPTEWSTAAMKYGRLYCGLCGNGTSYENDFAGIKCPWKAGDVIAGKETYQYIDFMGEDNGYVFKESQNGKDWEENSEGWTWRSPVTMPTAACRLWLKIKEIRCERIQDITEEGAKAEGVESLYEDKAGIFWYPASDPVIEPHEIRTHKAGYKQRHQSIYGPESWDLNPWHWIIIFEKTDKP